MAGFFTRNRLTLLTSIYWFLLTYIVAALIWWFIELWRQNVEEYRFRVEQVDRAAPDRTERLEKLAIAKKKKESQFIGEGVFFLLMTLTGAVYVYRTARRQIKLNDHQRRFMTALTHELKTPIAVARLNLETMRNRKLDPAMQEKLIGKTLEETNRLNDLCNNILLTSQLDAGDYRLNIEDIDLAELTARVTNDFRQRFPKRTLGLDVKGPASIRGDVLLLQLALSNLLENALKYSPPEGAVNVSLTTTSGRARIEVADEGRGIPDDEKTLVFGKFYRIAGENTPTMKGTGLGLWLCERIVQDHDGRIFILNNRPKGSIFVMEFPAK